MIGGHSGRILSSVAMRMSVQVQVCRGGSATGHSESAGARSEICHVAQGNTWSIAALETRVKFVKLTIILSILSDDKQDIELSDGHCDGHHDKPLTTGNPLSARAAAR